MGQPITISGTTVDGPVAAFHTDRTITGQDGVAYPSVESAAADGTFPGGLAERLFGADESIDHVFIASNQVVARRSEPWDDGALDRAAEIVARFFVFYPDAT